jgi:hypothetical protein
MNDNWMRFMQLFSQERNFASGLVILLLIVTGREGYGQFTSHLPIVSINTSGKEIPEDDPRIVAWMGVIDNGPDRENHLSDPFNGYDGQIAIELRGSSSLMFPKKNYSLETQDSLGENLNVALLGLPEENDWVLHGPYSDKTLMRNVLTFRLANDLGRYASRTRYCELFLNDNYRGVYVLMEKIKRDRNRVDIADLDADDLAGDSLTGGYVIKIDWYEGPDEGWTSHYSDHEINFAYHHPPADQLKNEQKEYIKDYVSAFEETLAGSGFKDEETGYRKYIQTASFIDYYIVNEFCRNVDGFSISVYLHKERDSRGGLLRMGPVWDFNLAYGNQYEGDFWSPEGWIWDHWLDPVPFWWERLMDDPAYNEELNCRWQGLRNDLLSLDRVYGLIDEYAEEIGPAVERNFDRWPVLGVNIWPNYFVGDSYGEEIGILKWWIAERLDWLDANMPGTCPGVGTETIRCEMSVNVYPNPSDGRFFLEISGGIPGEKEVEILGPDGRRVYRLILQPGPVSLEEIHLHDAAPGLYMIRIYHEMGQVTRKILIY